jgi:hypothetical protein
LHNGCLSSTQYTVDGFSSHDSHLGIGTSVACAVAAVAAAVVSSETGAADGATVSTPTFFDADADPDTDAAAA